MLRQIFVKLKNIYITKYFWNV